MTHHPQIYSQFIDGHLFHLCPNDIIDNKTRDLYGVNI